MKIPITKPFIDNQDINAIKQPVRSGWLVQGPNVKKFEKLFSDFAGSKYSIATTSCTTALHLSLIAGGVKKNDLVVIPSFTFIATANAVEYIGAKPVFCDIDLSTFNMNINHLGSLLKKYNKIKAVMPVHLFGLCADMKPILQLSKKYNFIIIEDAACATGAYYNNKHAGTFGIAGCFSFHPRKAITTGEGGMIVTNNKNIDNLCRILRNHGASKSDLQRHTEKGGSLLPEYNILGYNYRMTDIQGALGVTQMKKAKSILRKRIKRAAKYNNLLRNIEWLQTPAVPEYYIHAYQSYVCLIKKEHFNNSVPKANIFRNNLMEKLEDKGISTRQGTHAVHTLNYYKTKYKLKDNQYPNALEADRLSIALPLYPQMNENEQGYIIKQLKEYKKS